MPAQATASIAHAKANDKRTRFPGKSDPIATVTESREIEEESAEEPAADAQQQQGEENGADDPAA